MCADCVEICQHGEQIVATRPVYEGNTYADICATGSTLVCTIRKIYSIRIPAILMLRLTFVFIRAKQQA